MVEAITVLAAIHFEQLHEHQLHHSRAGINLNKVLIPENDTETMKTIVSERLHLLLVRQISEPADFKGVRVRAVMVESARSGALVQKDKIGNSAAFAHPVGAKNLRVVLVFLRDRITIHCRGQDCIRG